MQDSQQKSSKLSILLQLVGGVFISSVSAKYVDSLQLTISVVMPTNEIRSTDLRCASAGRLRLVWRLFVSEHSVCHILANSPKTTIAFSTRHGRLNRVTVRHVVVTVTSFSEVQNEDVTKSLDVSTQYRYRSIQIKTLIESARPTSSRLQLEGEKS